MRFHADPLMRGFSSFKSAAIFRRLILRFSAIKDLILRPIAAVTFVLRGIIGRGGKNSKNTCMISNLFRLPGFISKVQDGTHAHHFDTALTSQYLYLLI